MSKNSKQRRKEKRRDIGKKRAQEEQQKKIARATSRFRQLIRARHDVLQQRLVEFPEYKGLAEQVRDRLLSCTFEQVRAAAYMDTALQGLVHPDVAYESIYPLMHKVGTGLLQLPHETLEELLLIPAFFVEIEVQLVYGGWAARWVSCGRPVLRVTREQAASLALSDVNAEALEALRAPWPSFVVELDEPLKLTERRTLHRVFVNDRASFAPAAHWQLFYRDKGAGTMVATEPPASLVELHEIEPNNEADGRLSFGEQDARFAQIANRLALNACLAVTAHKATRRASAQERPRSSPIPVFSTSEYVLGTPVRVDMTDAVREYVSGKRASFRKSRWAVRGHWRNQVCGTARMERRLTWVSPHWRGPKELPALVRGYTLEGKKT